VSIATRSQTLHSLHTQADSPKEAAVNTTEAEPLPDHGPAQHSTAAVPLLGSDALETFGMQRVTTRVSQLSLADAASDATDLTALLTDLPVLEPLPLDLGSVVVKLCASKHCTSVYAVVADTPIAASRGSAFQSNVSNATEYGDLFVCY
jgi:hypothetical protein